MELTTLIIYFVIGVIFGVVTTYLANEENNIDVGDLILIVIVSAIWPASCVFALVLLLILNFLPRKIRTKVIFERRRSPLDTREFQEEFHRNVNELRDIIKNMKEDPMYNVHVERGKLLRKESLTPQEKERLDHLNHLLEINGKERTNS